MKHISIIVLTLLFAGLFSCEKNLIEANQQWQFADPLKANIKVVNTYASNIPAGAPGVGVTRFYVYQDLDKLNGNALPSPGSWPGSATYASVKPGTTAFNLILDRRVGNDYGKPAKGDTAFKGNIPLEASKFYTLFLIGESPNQSLYSIEDKLVEPQENFYAARFINLVVSPTPKPVDVYSRREKKNLATNLAFKTTTEFINIPVATIGDTLDVRDVGTTKILYSLANFNPASRRIYTFYTYGKTGFAAERLNSYTNK
jgi:hypothetical protein